MNDKMRIPEYLICTRCNEEYVAELVINGVCHICVPRCRVCQSRLMIWGKGKAICTNGECAVEYKMNRDGAYEPIEKVTA